MTAPTVRSSGYARDALLAAASRMAPLGVQLASTPFLLAHLSPGAFAAWTLTMTTINLFLSADLGVVGIMQRYHGIAIGRGDAALGGRITATVLTVLGALLVVLAVAGPWISDAIMHVVNLPAGAADEAGLLFRHAGALAALQLTALALSSYLAAHSRFLAVAAGSLVARAVLAGCIVVAVVTGAGLRGLLLAAYADAVVAVLITAVLCRKHLVREVRGFARAAELSELWAYSWRNQASAFGFIAQRELDVLMAAILLPTAAIVSVSAVAPLAGAVSLAPAVLLTPLFTRLSVRAGESMPAAAAEAEVAERAWWSLLLPFGALVVAILPFAAAAWLGPDVSGVVPLTALLSAGFVLSLAGSVRAMAARAVGSPGVETRAYVVLVLVKVVVGSALALAFGVYGLAAATILAAASFLISLAHAVRKSQIIGRTPLPPFRLTISTALLALVCGSAAAFVHQVIDGRIAQLALMVVIAMAGAAGALLAHRSSEQPREP